MPDVVLTAAPRAELGTPATRRLRASGQIPAVLYGHGADPVSISVDARELRNAFQHQAGAVLFDLRVGTDDHLVITREIQRHPVRRTISHIDFQVVRRDEVIPSDVPIHLVGEAVAVSRADGTIEQALTSLRVHAKPADIPPVIEIDVSSLEVGQAIRVSDLPALAGVVIDLDPETPIVLAVASRMAGEPEGGAEPSAESETPAEPESSEDN